MIHIYTRDFFWSERVKRIMKRLFRISEGGPQAVEGSLLRGLRDLHVPFVLNQHPRQPIDVACVVSGGPKSLRWAVQQKRKGLVKKILGGPIIVITPNEDDWLIASPEVDAFVVPSPWVKNWWASFNPKLADKIKLWPAGVQDTGSLVKKDGKVLVFQKNAPDPLYQSVIQDLETLGLAYEVMRYGSFSHEEYMHALSRSRFMIYLSQSESQGIALFEAWMAGVPTLVWNRGYMSYGAYRWEDSMISAPFLNDKLGTFFKDQSDFSKQCSTFLAAYQSFTPRTIALDQFTDSAMAKKYLEIIHSL